MITLDVYSERIGISVENLKSKSRNTEIVVPRQVYWFYLKSQKYNFCEIGRLFGKSHGTIIFGVKRIQNLIDIKDLYIEKYLKAVELI